MSDNANGEKLDDAEPNPTPAVRSAIALRYDPHADPAPLVVASGQEHLADQIIAKARRHRIPIKEDKSLASALAGLDCGKHIPPEMFRAVAEVIAWVYRLEQQAAKKR